MSWVSKLTGIHLGNIGAPVGAALGSFIPGVGTALGAGLGQAIGGVGAGHGVAKSALEGAGVYGGSKLAGALMPHESGTIDPSDPNVGNANVNMTGGGVGGFLSGAVKSALGGGQPGQGGGTNPWLMGLAGLEGANSAYLGHKANALSDKALKETEANYAARAPLRAKGLAGLINPTAPDVSQLQTIAARNPYSVPAPLPRVA